MISHINFSFINSQRKKGQKRIFPQKRSAKCACAKVWIVDPAVFAPGRLPRAQIPLCEIGNGPWNYPVTASRAPWHQKKSPGDGFVIAGAHKRSRVHLFVAAPPADRNRAHPQNSETVARAFSLLIKLRWNSPSGESSSEGPPASQIPRSGNMLSPNVCRN